MACWSGLHRLNENSRLDPDVTVKWGRLRPGRRIPPLFGPPSPPPQGEGEGQQFSVAVALPVAAVHERGF